MKDLDTVDVCDSGAERRYALSGISVEDLINHQNEYQKRGITTTKAICSAEDAGRIAGTLLDLAAQRGIKRDRLFDDPDTGGTTIHKDTIVDTAGILESVPEIEEFYEAARVLIQNTTSRPVVSSPFEDSRLTLKVYKGVGSEHGWHNDTNSVSGILALTDNPDDSPLVYCARGTKEVAGAVHCEAGKLIILKGHDIWHRVEPVQREDTVRATLIMNYYHPGEERRLEGFDEGYYA